MNIKSYKIEKKQTPVSIFFSMRKKFGSPVSLFESISIDEKNKMSIIAACPICEICSYNNSFEKLEQALSQTKKINIKNLPFQGGLIGYFNFEIFGEIEKNFAKKTELPNAIFYEFSRLVFFDHKQKKIIFVQTNENPDFEKENLEILEQTKFYKEKKLDPKILKDKKWADFSKINLELTFEEFAKKVDIAKKAIFDGEIFQIIVSNGFQKKISHNDALRFYEILRIIEPTTHLFLLDFGEKYGQICGATPEILGTKKGKNVWYRPIAGTRFRGKNKKEDMEILAKMKKNEKENAEHDMLVDLGRNDLGKVCLPGTVKMTKKKYGKFFANLMHMISDLKGEIDKKNFGAIDFFKSIFPAGTLSGAPKIRAIEIIQKLEKNPRGLYGGSVGYFSADQNMEFCIAIRSFFLKNNIIKFRTGGGIVQDSVAEDEWLELHNKATSLVKVFNFVEK